MKEEELKQALTNFLEAWQNLSEKWEDVDPQLDCEKYPFERAFDDYDIDSWIKEFSDNLNSPEEKDVPVLFYTIKNKISWGKWCDVTGGNHYAFNEGYSPDDNEVFYCTESQAKELGIV